MLQIGRQIYPAAELLKLPTSEAIRILNEISYPNLAKLFRQNPQLAKKYQALYQLGIDESLSSPSLSSFQREEKGREITGLIPSHLADQMSLQSNAVTMKLLLDWWLLYFVQQGLYQDGTIYPDAFTDRALGPWYLRWGISPQSFFPYYMLMYLMGTIFRPQVISPEEEREIDHLDGRIVNQLRQYQQVLSSAKGVEDFLESAIEMDREVGQI